jgi:hypothetical protein
LIRVLRPFHAWLHYDVLAHLDLGLDAANLYTPGRVDAPWVPALHALYRADPERLRCQFLPLHTPHMEALLAAIHTDGLRTAFGTAYADRFETMCALWDQDDGFDDRKARFAEAVAPRLQRLRHALWEDQSTPPLTVLDVPSLGPHARAIWVAGARVVATSLMEDSDHILCQVFHEETHPHSDPISLDAPRDTDPSGPGWRQHRLLEESAIALGQRVVDHNIPALGPAYARWIARLRWPT